MAQKLGLALFALFGLANSQISYLGEHSLGLASSHAPAVTFSNLHSEDDDAERDASPLLGEQDLHLGFGILNFANQADHSDDAEDTGSRLKADDSHKQVKGNEAGKGDRSGKSTASKQEKPAPKQEKPSPKKEKPAPKQVKPAAKQESDDHGDKSREQEQYVEKVAIPVFTNLHYVDVDSHGESAKAPITIVTAPLVSTAEVEHHRVAVNQAVGKSNCPECLEENKEASETKESATKAIQRNDNLLTTVIHPIIENVEDDHKESHKQQDDKKPSDGAHKPERRNNHSSRGDAKKGDKKGKDNQDDTHYEGDNINQEKLHQQLAEGEARQNAPFVVGKVVIPAQGNLRTEDHEDEQVQSERRHN